MPFIVIGLTFGSIYSLAALGLVLTYKTSGVFNFAHGAIAAIAAFVFYDLWQREGVPWGITAVLCIFVLGPLMGLLLELLTRALARVGTAYQVVGTVGLALGINGALTLWASGWSDNVAFLPFPPFLPTDTFTVFNVNVGYDQAITMGVALVSAIGLYLFFRYSRLGVAMRGVVDNPELVNITGTNPTGVRRWSWVIGTIFAAMSGVLLGPVLGLNALLLILLVVQAYGAAAIGYFSNLPLTYVGGLLLGVGAALCTKYVGDVQWLGGLPASLPFIVLFIALLVTPRAKLALRRPPPPPPPRVAYTAPARVSITGAVLVVAVLAFVPDLVGLKLAAWTLGVMYVVLFLSLGLLVRTSGQVSLCQLGFAAVGAAAYGNLVTDHGIPWLPALILAGLITVPVGLIIAIPAIRLSGVFLALATLGFGIMLEHMFYTQDVLFGPLADGIKSPAPGFRDERPRLLLPGPRGRGGVRDRDRRDRSRSTRPAPARALRLAARARHAGRDHERHARPRVRDLRVLRRHLRRALRGILRLDQRLVVPVVHVAHDHRGGRARGRRSAVVRARGRCLLPDHPHVSRGSPRHPRHPGVRADLLRLRRRVRRCGGPKAAASALGAPAFPQPAGRSAAGRGSGGRGCGTVPYPPARRSRWCRRPSTERQAMPWLRPVAPASRSSASRFVSAAWSRSTS